MKQLMLLFCYLLFISNSIVLGQIPTGCSVEGLDGALHMVQIADTDVEKEIYSTKFQGDLSVSNCFGIDYDYFEVTMDDTNLHITTTSLMADFDKNTPKTSTPMALLNLNCTFTCSEEKSTYIFQFQVTDTNNHPPEFDKPDGYEFMVPIPLMPRIDFTIYGDTIMATDIDFSNQNIDYTIEPDDFAITTFSDSTVKNYTAIFATKNIIQLTESKTYTLTATDTGRPPSSTSTTITITPDESLSIDTPSFNELSYSFNYTVSDNVESLTPNGGPITIATLKPKSVKEPTITGEYSGYFSAYFDSGTNVIDFVVNEMLPTTAEAFIVLTLAVETDNSASTSIVVYIAAEATEAPQFSNHYYVGNYDDASDTVTLADEIKITSPRTPDVSILGDLADHFNIKYDEATKSCEILIKSSLTPAELKGLSYITLTLKASVGEHYDTSALVLSLPEHVLQFTEALYEATYNTDNTVTVSEGHPISFTTDATEATVTIADSKYSKSFEIKEGSEKGQYEISVTTPLPDDAMKTEHEVLLTLTASDAYGNEARTAITIKLPLVATDTPAFSKKSYIGNYVFDSATATLTVEDIAIVNRDPSLVTIQLDSYTENFGISYTDDKWVFSLLKNLDDPTVKANKEIIIFLTASVEGEDEKGQAALVINLVPKAAPIFSKGYYKGVYPEKGDGEITLDGDISFTNIKDPKTVAIELDSYKENFEITYDTDKWVVTIKNVLDDSVIAKNTELIIVLSATETGNTNKGSSILVLELPSSDTVALKFDKSYYVAQYPKDGSGTIDFEEPLKLINVDDPTTVEITVDNYADNFEVQYISDKWQIHVKEALDKDVLKGNQQLVMTLTAVETGKTEPAYSVLVLELPAGEIDTTLKFEEAYYVAKYSENKDKTIDFENAIKFLNAEDPTAITINLDKYEDYFKVTYTSGKWILNVQNVLGEDILGKNVELVVTMTAKETGDEGKEGHSALIIELPRSETESSPIFSDSYYLANYPAEYTGSIEFESPVSFENVDDSTVTITLDNYADNFDIVFENGKWLIVIKKNLEQSVLDGSSELVITLIATDTSLSKEGKSALILRLPPKDETAPIFSKTYYTAKYTVTGSETNVVLENPIDITNKDDIKTISLSVENYKDNFDIEYDNDAKSWVVKVLKLISDDVLLEKTDLTLAITATNVDNDKKDHAAINLALPHLDTEKAPKFAHTIYTALYSISGDKASVTFDTPLEITNKDNLKDITIGINNYDNFEIVYDEASKSWNMNVLQNLDQAILNERVDLAIELTATENDNDEIGQTALILRLPVINNEDAPKFSSIYYYGTYVTGDKATVNLDKIIEITNKADLSKVTISFDTSYRDNFEITYNADKSQFELKTKTPLSKDVFKDIPDLILTLTATEDGNSEIGQAALVLHLPIQETKLPPKFNNAHYSAKYTVDNHKGSLVLNEAITVVNKEDLSKVKVNLDSYGENFGITFDSTKKQWDLSVVQSLPEELVDSMSELILTLTATETDNENDGESTLIVSLGSSTTTDDFLEFSEVHYSADYHSEGKGSITTNDKIKVNVKDGSKTAVVTIESEDYATYFNIEPNEDVYEITLTSPLPTEILEKETSLILTLVAAVDEAKARATLVINLPVAAGDTRIRFEDPLYSASYKIVDGKVVFAVEDTIKVATDEDDASVEKSISSSTGYESYFKLDYSKNEITVSLVTDLPEDVLRSNSFIPLILTVGVTGTTAKSSAVLNIEISTEEDQRSIAFSSVLYGGKYEVTEGNVDFTINDKITINTDEADENIEVKITNEFESFFSVEYSAKEVVITLHKNLTADTLGSHTVVPLTLQAGIKDTSYVTSAVLNIEIRYDGDSDTDDIEFDSVLYTGVYSVANGIAVLKLDDPIRVITNRADEDIEISISSIDTEYAKYFSIEYSDLTATIQIKTSLPDEVVQEASFLAFTLSVGIKNTALTGSAVLNIIINTEQQNRAISFSRLLYAGKYTVTDDGKGNLEIDQTISLETTEPDENVKVSVTNEYESFFSVAYSEKLVTISITKPLTDTILDSLSVVPLTLQAEISGTSAQSLAVLNIAIIYNNDGDTQSIEFASVLYNGQYTITNGSESFKMNDVVKVIVTDSPDDQVQSSISDDSQYGSYFDVSYSENTVSVKLAKSLPSDVTKSNSFIALTLIVEIKETPHTSSAVLNIDIQNNDNNDNNGGDSDDEDSKTELQHLRITFIVVTAVLSVLLIACIAGAIAYYFLRIRGESYSNLGEDGSGRVRFGKHSLTRSPSSNKSSALEERRPTGFIFHPINEDMSENADSPTDLDKTRRKSVAFDDNVEKMQIDIIKDDDVDVYSSDKSQVTHV